MSVYIKGMEMPTTCCHCKLMVYNTELVWDDAGTKRTGAWVCLLTGELIDNTKREEHCPLIPVPDHGRLIDADALEEKADDRYSLGEIGRRERDDIVDALRYCAPTIIPADKESGE